MTDQAQSADLPQRPVSILIAALGGEGGGVLTGWLVAAAERENYVAQSTSIPGVAQRTGATTYFVEIYPVPTDVLGDKRPVLTLLPSPGGIDIMAASELLEAGRAMQNGFITPDRTTLIASTHRVYATLEKMHLGDGRFDAGRVIAAAQEMALSGILFDMGEAAKRSGSIINAVLLGAMAGSGRLPMKRETLEDTIREGGIAVDANLKGFAAGFELASAGTPAPEVSEPATGHVPAELNAGALAERVDREYPGTALAMVREGVARLIEYQDPTYAGLFLDRLDAIRGLDGENGGEAHGFDLTVAAAKALAHWMAFEDVIRVADLKTRPERLARIREEAGAGEDEPVVIVDFLKPGLEEICSILPGFISRPLLAWAEKRGKLDAFNIGLHVKTSGAFGYALLRTVSKFKGWRRRGHRYAAEQALIERWLTAVRTAVPADRELAREIIDCARLVKGYGETHRRGVGNLTGIFDSLVEPELENPAPGLATRIADARDSALADAEGLSLAAQLGLQPQILNKAAE